MGMFLCMGTAVAGDVKKLELKALEKGPYLRAKINGISTKELEDAFEDFTRFASDIEEVLMIKLPNMVETAA